MLCYPQPITAFVISFLHSFILGNLLLLSKENLLEPKFHLHLCNILLPPSIGLLLSKYTLMLYYKWWKDRKGCIYYLLNQDKNLRKLQPEGYLIRQGWKESLFVSQLNMYSLLFKIYRCWKTWLSVIESNNIRIIVVRSWAITETEVRCSLSIGRASGAGKCDYIVVVSVSSAGSGVGIGVSDDE